MRKNSRAKGSKFERDIAKVFEAWTHKRFSRTPLSGGWHKAVNAVGDLICATEGHVFPFTVECKFHQEIRFEHVLLGNKTCKILDFWKQAKDEAKMAKKHPLLVMKYNGMGRKAFVGVSHKVFKHIRTVNPSLSFHKKGKPIVHILLLSDLVINDYRILCKKLK